MSTGARLRTGTVVALVGGCLVASAPFARADVDRLQLSLDGRTWSGTIEQPLLDPARRWVPGDAERITVWIRNDSGAAAELRVDLVDVTGTLRLGRDVSWSAELDGRPAAGSSGPTRLVATTAPAGRPQRLDLLVSLPASAGNRTQRSFLRADVRVSLTGPGGADAPAPDGLAATGAPLSPAVWALAFVLLVGGVASWRRRSPREVR